jgi:hypothetical protein
LSNETAKYSPPDSPTDTYWHEISWPMALRRASGEIRRDHRWHNWLSSPARNRLRGRVVSCLRGFGTGAIGLQDSNALPGLTNTVQSGTGLGKRCEMAGHLVRARRCSVLLRFLCATALFCALAQRAAADAVTPSTSPPSKPPHRLSTTLIGDTPIPGEAMLPRNRVRTSWNGTGHR